MEYTSDELQEQIKLSIKDSLKRYILEVIDEKYSDKYFVNLVNQIFFGDDTELPEVLPEEGSDNEDGVIDLLPDEIVELDPLPNE